jgi:signal transduction histidine kinase
VPRHVLHARLGALESPVDDERRIDLGIPEIESLLVVPLLAGGETFGTMALASTSPVRRLGAGDLPLAEEAARRTASALQNARLYKKAVQATQARDELLGIVAHDLRNPLNALLIEASLLRREGAITDAIERAAHRMTRLIDDLLDVTRLEPGRLSIERERVSVSELVADCARAQMPLAARRSLELSFDVEPDLPDVFADRDRLPGPR